MTTSAQSLRLLILAVALISLILGSSVAVAQEVIDNTPMLERGDDTSSDDTDDSGDSMEDAPDTDDGSIRTLPQRSGALEQDGDETTPEADAMGDDEDASETTEDAPDTDEE